VEASKVDAEDILKLYFEKKPPFGDGKKKAEFPDALSLLSLQSHLENNEKIYVISDDGDLRAYCEAESQFIQLDTLDHLLDIYNQNTQHTNVLSEHVKNYFIQNDENLKRRITEYLEDCKVYNSSSWEDAFVDDGLMVNNIGNINPSILTINDEKSLISFNFDVEFEVTVTGPDFNNGIYDREEGQMFTFDNTSKTISISKKFTAVMFLNYDYIDGVLANVEDDEMHIAGVENGIEISVEENDNE
jgi:hypothetical protein